LHLQALSDETGMAIRSAIIRHQQVEQDRTPVVFLVSLNWKGKPFETVVNLIGGTKTWRTESQGCSGHKSV
jgi:hypothetical protein